MAKPVSNPKKRVFNALKEDGEYKKFRKLYKNIIDTLTVDKFIDEAKALHAGRTSRSLHEKKQFNPRALIEASTKDLSVRARLVEIRIRVSVSQSRLDEAMDAMKRYLNTEFYDDLSEYKTVDIKKALVERVISKPLDVMSDIKNLVEILDTIIRDIDQSNFHLKTVIEALKLLDDSKGKVI